MSEAKGITKIAVSGFKSLRDRSEIEVRPLTILAGANSSGKSSIMQPLLLMKQTLEAVINPGALRLEGPNAEFTSAEQFLSIIEIGKQFSQFQVEVENSSTDTIVSIFKKLENNPSVQVTQTRYESASQLITLRLGMKHDEVLNQMTDEVNASLYALKELRKSDTFWGVAADRCFLSPAFHDENGDLALTGSIEFKFFPINNFKRLILELIHVPGLRKLSRNMPLSPITGGHFVGTFENYTANVIAGWAFSDPIAQLSSNLKLLELTANLGFRLINGTHVEIQVNRLKNKTPDQTNDLVSIADVGFGVSQVLPVLVALLAAEPGQLVYIEQPELHLHPRAQHKLAQVLADAANRGVRVVIETHSDLLLLGVQTLVAEGTLDKEKVILHWFERNDDGSSKITPAELNEDGSFGDWPVDFGEVTLEAQGNYLDAAESLHLEK